MELISASDFAKKLGVTRQAISKAIKRGDLRTVPDGKRKKIDLHDAKTIEYVRNHNAQRKGSPVPEPVNGSTDGKDAISASGGDDNGGGGLLDATDALQAGASSRETRDDRIKTQTATEKMKLAKEMGVLILTSMVDKLFDKLYAIILNHFHPLGARLASVLSDIAGVTDPAITLEIKKAIDKETARGLNEFKREASNAISRIRP